MIAGANIDVYIGTLSMEFGDNIVNFKIFEAMKHPIENYSMLFNHSFFLLNLIDLDSINVCCTIPNLDFGSNLYLDFHITIFRY